MIYNVTDISIVLECLHEAYGEEKKYILEGNVVRRTMAFPFLKMLEIEYKGMSAKQIHKILWQVYKNVEDGKVFVQQARYRLDQTKGG